jgi:hypothetical protein
MMQAADNELNNGAKRYFTVALAILGASALLAAFAMGVTASSAVSSSSTQASTAIVAASAPITLPSPCWSIGVITDGLHRLPYDALAAAGMPVAGADPDDVHLLWRGQEVALHEIGDGDTTFESGESFLFYGRKLHGSTQDEKYTGENVYWLYVDDSTPGLRMSERSVAPGEGGQPLEWYTATAYAEENLIYWARHYDSPGTDTTWFWEWIFTVGSPVTDTYPLTLTEPAPHTYTGTVVLEVAARTTEYPNHRVRLTINDTPIGEVDWVGKTGAVFTLPVPSTALVPGVNDMKVTVLTTTSIITEQHRIYVDRFELAYHRRPVAENDALHVISPLSGSAAMTLTDFAASTIYLYDVAHPLTPTRLVDYATSLSGTTYMVSLSDTTPAGTPYLAVGGAAVIDVVSPTILYPANDLVNPSEGADEIIIVPTAFITAVQPLSAARRSQGLRVHVVDVNDVYALFNGGIVHPEAIRSFVAHAYANWPGDTLQYLLLFGDGDMNPKGYNPAEYGEPAPTLIPPYLEFADPSQGEVAVDSRYGDVDWDGMPEVMVGRIPADSVQQAEAAVAKILAYEGAPIGPWQSRIMMVTDNGGTSPEGYEEMAERLVSYLPDDAAVHAIHLRDYCGAATPSNSTTPCPSATLALTQTWSQGAAMITYIGHAGVHRWGHEPLLLNTQMAQLNSTTGLPFVISLDCWDGNWMWPVHYPFQDATDARSMGEWATTVLTDRGAIAAFGPSGLAFAETEEPLAQAIYQEMYENNVYRLGDLTQAGREAISSSYMARTYTLLGDPAMELKRIPTELYLPLIQRDE